MLPSLAQEGELEVRAALGLGPLPTMTPHFRVSRDITEADLATAFATVVRRHAPLRSALLGPDEHEKAAYHKDSSEAAGKSSWRVRVDRPGSAFVDYWSTEDEAEFRHALDVPRVGFHAPIAASVLRVGGRPRYLVVSVDHLAFDGVSLVLLTDEMNQVLDNLRAGSAPEAGLPVVEPDYYTLARSTRTTTEKTLAECVPYWRDTLAGIGPYPPVELPGLDPAPAAAPRDRVHAQVDLLDPAPFRGFCQARQATPFVAFQAALAAAITRLGGRYTGANSNAAYRTDPRSWHLIGFFSNLITFAPPPPADPTDPLGWIATLRTTAFEAISRSLLPRSTLLPRLYPDTYPTRPAAPHLHFEFDDIPPSGSREPALVLQPPPVGVRSTKSHAGLECTAVMLANGSGLLRVAYQDGGCAPEAVAALLDTWLHIVEKEMVEK